MWTMLIILGAWLAIGRGVSCVDDDGGVKGGRVDVWGGTRDVNEFWITCTLRVSKVEWNCNCWGLRGYIYIFIFLAFSFMSKFDSTSSFCFIT